MHKFFLVESGTVEEIRAHLTEAIARHPGDKNLHEALHQLDTGLHVSDLVPDDFKEESGTPLLEEAFKVNFDPTKLPRIPNKPPGFA
ncbi:hypothetical protein H6G00_05150 [Leptolyngbya sp. FACHB-541]|uniref:hypothetical protein n=1 Tax=Leptolyngbya sp. FACHB-541 TaxID=2692810 RepID=UPI001682C03E|nr:hypothetical protein [Leptolyngbya sp. FACHB-541]MBD1996003.1 hypothetical protein [Leptolyngbya sp. FACHB-541]